MSDDRLRELERQLQETPDDRSVFERWWRELERLDCIREMPGTRHEYWRRCSLVRHGRVEEAGLQAGDVMRWRSHMHKATRLYRVLEVTRANGQGARSGKEGGRVTVRELRDDHGGAARRGNRGAEWMGELWKPFDQDTRRVLAIPPGGVSARRKACRGDVARILGETWCLGAGEIEADRGGLRLGLARGVDGGAGPHGALGAEAGRGAAEAGAGDAVVRWRAVCERCGLWCELRAFVVNAGSYCCVASVRWERVG